ncbi:class I SAM-dependent methyltransferase [Salininema proteolyticum]|uniref:Class I SAM-dependent methyltransferase n=1 Tax=Salininema proteolyticum TaxID=1607685 RepID=A0ABV8U1A5_9ACTN
MTRESLDYWRDAGASKTFTHPLVPERLDSLDRSARILDYGCGYGRVMAELSDLGFTGVQGVDPSAALVSRGRGRRPDLSFTVLDTPPSTPFPEARFEAVLLFAVLTCVPDGDAQAAVMAEVARVLKPGGLLYVSDMPLQDDERNRERYDAHAERHGGPYGVFTTGDGATFRHHGPDELRGLLADFDILEEHRLAVPTINGNRSEAVQILARRA